MKDLVENRRRIGLGEKARLAGLVLKENGLVWTSLMGLYYASSGIADLTFKQAHKLRSRRNLPGLNSMSANKLIWDTWDWHAKGDEWTPSDEWKRSVVSTFVDPYFSNLDTILEVGPGAGRWTEFLIDHCKRFIAVDISESCVRECNKRFAGYANATFHVGSGKDLSVVPDQSIDGVWSFDVFVHINKPQFNSYIAEFKRVLKPGGVGLIHHGGSGGKDGGWRSDVTIDDVTSFMNQNGLAIDRQLQSWIDDGTKHEAGLYKDYITIFRKL
jgi:SAM-dependent methyltransferase